MVPSECAVRVCSALEKYYYYIWGLIRVFSNYYSHIEDRKRTRVRLDKNVAPWSRSITNVISPLHECKKVGPFTIAPFLSGIRSWIKQGRRKRKKRQAILKRRLELASKLLRCHTISSVAKSYVYFKFSVCKSSFFTFSAIKYLLTL